jgi:hypothetical protein
MRKPIEQEVKGFKTPRERIWTAMSTMTDPWTINDVRGWVKPAVKRSAVVDYVKALEAGQYLVRVGTRPGTALTAEVLYSIAQRSHDAPRINKAGERVTQGMTTLAMWRCMRVLKRFSLDELARTATVGELIVTKGTVKTYIKHLHMAGYVVQLKQGIWRLVRDTGPHAPAITRLRVVFDRNTGTFAAPTAQEITDALE